MNTAKMSTGMRDRRALLSTLWIVIMLNMLAADILSFMYPGFLNSVMNGKAGAVQITPVFLLVAAIFMEIAIAMIFLSRVLNHQLNRWANIIAAAITILFVIGGGSTYLHYLFIETVEVICSILIIWLGWKWVDPEG